MTLTQHNDLRYALGGEIIFAASKLIEFEFFPIYINFVAKK